MRPRRVVTIPLTPPDVVARVELPYPLSDEEWKQFNLVLFAMHPGLVERSVPSQEHNPNPTNPEVRE